MRKINENDYIDFTYKDNGFSVTMGNLKDIITLFNKREHGMITGRKVTGYTAIIDQK